MIFVVTSSIYNNTNCIVKDPYFGFIFRVGVVTLKLVYIDMLWNNMENKNMRLVHVKDLFAGKKVSSTFSFDYFVIVALVLIV